MRCRKAGVCVPGLRIVDVKQGVLGIEWVEGWSVREVLGGGQDDDEGAWEYAEEGEEMEEEGEEEVDVQALLRGRGVEEGEFFAARGSGWSRQELMHFLWTDALLQAIGREIGKMHLADVIHGDLTTSNMMVRLVEPSSSRPSTDVLSGTAAPLFEVVRFLPFHPVTNKS